MSTHPIFRLLLPIVIAGIFVGLDSDFLLAGNFYALTQLWAIISLVTLGLSLTMICGEFDLSVGAIFALSGLVMIKTGEDSTALGVVFAISVGAGVEFFNGMATVLLRVPSLLLTLGTMISVGGLALWVEGGQLVYYANFDASDMLDARFFGILSLRSVVTITTFVVFIVILRFSRLGRDMYATGSNRAAALMSGARVEVSIVAAFIASGMLAASAGALTSISLATASARFGDNSLIQAATAAIVGGVSLSGGVGHPAFIALGAFTMVLLNNGLSMIGASSATVLLVNGIVLLIVVLSEGNLSTVIRNIIGRERPGFSKRKGADVTTL